MLSILWGHTWSYSYNSSQIYYHVFQVYLLTFSLCGWKYCFNTYLSRWSPIGEGITGILGDSDRGLTDHTRAFWGNTFWYNSGINNGRNTCFWKGFMIEVGGDSDSQNCLCQKSSGMPLSSSLHIDRWVHVCYLCQSTISSYHCLKPLSLISHQIYQVMWNRWLHCIKSSSL